VLTVDNVVASPHPGHIDTTVVLELLNKVLLFMLVRMLVFWLSITRADEVVVVVVVVVGACK